MGTLSVCMSVYKNERADYLKDSLNSIIAEQTRKPDEIVLIVEGPVLEDLDEVIECFDCLYPDLFNIIRLSENKGLGFALKLAVEKAKCDYIARMDTDDISLPGRFEKQITFLEKNPDIDVVGGAIEEIDERGNSRGKIVVYPEAPAECRKFFAKRNPHAHPAVMFRRRYFEKAGCSYREDYRNNQDTMLWFDGMMAGTQHANLQDVVLKFRVTEAMFKKRRNGWRFAKKQLKDRFMINKGLGYGIGADIYGLVMFGLLISPVWIKRIAYNIFR